MKPYSKNMNTPIVPNVLVSGQTMLTQKKPGSMKNWNQEDLQLLEATPGGILLKKEFLKISQNSQEKNLCQSLFFNTVAGLRPATLFKKRLWHRMFSCEFCEFLKNTIFYNMPLVVASELCIIYAYTYHFPNHDYIWTKIFVH